MMGEKNITKRYQLKVCGMLDAQNIKDLLDLQPDYMGFIFYEKSKRFVGEKLDSEVLRSFPKLTKKVGVFVNANIATILTKVSEFELDYIQLHGEESPAYCKSLRFENMHIIKAFSVDDFFDFNTLKEFDPWCDYFLFDTKGLEKGGNGITFNWQILEKYAGDKPFFLAGGVDLDNLNKIKALPQGLKIHAIDINSRFESEPGFKNIAKIREFKNNLH